LTKLQENELSVQEPDLTVPFSERLFACIQLHMAGIAGDSSAVMEAKRLLEQLRLDYPGSTLADAYYGSTLILVARDQTKPLDKLKWSNQGLKILDKAVADAPHDTTIRLLRGKNAYNLPEQYFQRTQTAIEDYTFLIQQGAQQDETQHAQLIFELGDAYRRIGRNQDAMDTWKMLNTLSLIPELQQFYLQKIPSLEGKPAVEVIPNDSPASMLVGAAREIGTALLDWAEPEKARERAKAKKKAQEKAKEIASEQARQKAKELAREKAKEQANVKPKQQNSEKPKQQVNEKTKEQAKKNENEKAKEKAKTAPAMKKKVTPPEKYQSISNSKSKEKAEELAKEKAREMAKERAKIIARELANRRSS
jgi:pyruvate/2-oxoglutarate dehydrogenase complex dihydrolipoamide acyltransferase (E2) component